jgi:hypothetical protein
VLPRFVRDSLRQPLGGDGGIRRDAGLGNEPFDDAVEPEPVEEADACEVVEPIGGERRPRADDAHDDRPFGGGELDLVGRGRARVRLARIEEPFRDAARHGVDVVVDVAERLELLEHVVRVDACATDARQIETATDGTERLEEGRPELLRFGGLERNEVGAVGRDPPDLGAAGAGIGKYRTRASFVVSAIAGGP